MTSYRIVSPNFVASLTETSDAVTQASPVLAWTVGQTFSFVRDYCQARGWEIIPLLESHHPVWLEYHGVMYELHWIDGTLCRITRYDDGVISAISFSELPNPLKHLIS